MSLTQDWYIAGNRIFFHYKPLGKDIWFDMPAYVTDLPPDRYLRLAEWLMLSPWHDIDPEPRPVPPHKMTGTKNVLLAFSGGVDSTAALQVLRGCTPAYVERAGIRKGLLNQEAHTNFCDKIKALRIRTNFELLRTAHGKQIGYSTGRAMAVPLVLAAFALGAHSIAYGAVLDDNHFPKGVYRGLTQEYHRRQQRFLDAGLYCVEPLLGCSEVVTTAIVQRGPYAELARSCLRGTKGEQCGKCYKCMRKNILIGKDWKICREAENMIKKNPPKMAGPLIYGLQKAGATCKGMEYAEGMDVGWLARNYPPLLDTLPAGVRETVQEQLAALDIEPMTTEDIANMTTADFRRPTNG